jgi:redox-sensitive bicupin YhaK (pirin superfamily)
MPTAKIQSRIPVQPMRHGAGFEALGLRGSDAQMSPYLMADHYRMTQPTFGPHPHAGFSAVTYMFDDAQTGFHNRDSRGFSNTIAPGDVHWTVAGSGVVHDEVPVEPGKVAHGLQLFVNLPAAKSHMTPTAIHVTREALPVVEPSPGVRVKVGFGAYDDGERRATAQADWPTDAHLFDVEQQAASVFRYPLTNRLNAMLLVIAGSVEVDATTLQAGHAVALGQQDAELVVQAKEAAHWVLLLGSPLNQAVVRHGPFAMPSQDELIQAIEDYQRGKMGSL